MNLITYYEKELNQKCYMIRGDEGYSNTTDTILKVTGNIDESSLSYFVCPFRVEVLRDMDATDSSFVEIYDGDEVVLTIPWSTNITHHDFTLNLPYGMEHNIRARYSGNRLCLRSYSQIINFNKPIPTRNVAVLNLYQYNSSWDTDTAGDITARIRDSNNTVLASKVINLYIDEEFVGGGTTGSNGRVTFSNIKPADLVDDDVDDRVYDVMVEFNGDDYYAPTTYNARLSVGFDIRVDEYDKVLINTESLSVKSTMFNKFGYVPSAMVSGATVHVEGYKNGTWTRICAKTTMNSDGKATMTVSRSNVNSYKVNNVLTWRVIGQYNNKNYYSDVQTTTVYSPNSMTFETTKPIIGVGQISNLRGAIDGVPEGIRVQLTGDVNETITTMANGRFETIYDGQGDGAKSVTATCGAVTETITFRDVIQYWDAVHGSINKLYTILSNYVLELSNGFKFSPQNAQGYSQLGIGNGTILTHTSWILSFKVVNSTNHFDFVVGSWKLDDNGERIISTINISNLTLNQGQIITIGCENGLIDVRVDGDVVASDITYLEGGNPVIGIKDEDKNHYLTINNLEFIRE